MNKLSSSKSKIRIYLSLLIMGLLFNIPAFAMGKAPAKEEKPKYKLEILKMELVTEPTTTAEVAPVQKSPVKKKWLLPIFL